jgi:hypothetical protein
MSERAIATNNGVLDHQETLNLQDSVNFTKLATELGETSRT